MKALFALLALVVGSLPLQAQITKPSASPRALLRQQVGLAQVDLDYGRPGVKGRRIFGALEPYGRVWRTGANASTKISFDRAVRFAGQDVPAGSYALYTIPEEDAWTVILHRNTGLWGAGGYDPAQDLLRVRVVPLELPEPRESLQIDFERFRVDGADLFIAWSNVKVVVPVLVDSHEEVMQEIEEKVRQATGEVSAGTYFDAGMHLYETRTDLDQAAEWMDLAIERAPNAFWMVYFRAELAQAMGEAEYARELASRSLEMATASRGGDFGYIAKSRLLLEALGGQSSR